MSKLSKVKLELQKMLLQFGSQATDKGTLEYAGESFEVGIEVYIEDEPAADGEYTQEDGTVIVVADGKVAEIREPQPEEETPVEEVPQENAEEEVVETPAEEPVEEKPEMDLMEVLQPIVDMVKGLEQKVMDLNQKIADLETKLQDPAGKPLDEKYEELVDTNPSGFYRK